MILAQFLIESVVLSMIGGLIGIVLGVGRGLGGGRNLKRPIHRCGQPDAIGLAVGFLVAGGRGVWRISGGRAARLSPIEALRFE